MDLLPDKQNCVLRMYRECRERFPCHRLQRKPLVSDPGMHHGMCVTHVLWCMSGSLNRGGGENVPDIPGASATHNFTYLARGPCQPCKCYGCTWDWYSMTYYSYVTCAPWRLELPSHHGASLLCPHLRLSHTYATRHLYQSVLPHSCLWTQHNNTNNWHMNDWVIFPQAIIKT